MLLNIVFSHKGDVLLNRIQFIFCSFIVCLFISLPVSATSVKAIALFENRAMLSVDGGKAKIVRVGKTLSGVKLLSSNTSEAVIEVNGKRERLTLNSSLVLEESLGSKASNSYASSVQLFVDSQGFFRGKGAINGEALEFLVDTGANLVVLNSVEANRIGIDYKSGAETFAQTASGVAPMYLITAKKMSLGGIELSNVQMGVIEGGFPAYPLLGMTFLGRLNMERSGEIMTLSR